MVYTINPSPGKKIYDPCCGTGGFLAIAYEHIARKLGASVASTDQPNIWHGNTLTRRATYCALFEQAPPTFDVILTNPPIGGKEGKDAQKNFAFETSSTQVLFVQDILSELAVDGTCGIVLDEGLLFRTNENAFVETKRKLVHECHLCCIISLPGGVFSTAGAGVKTNLVFFTRGKKTETIWYYDLTHVKVGKKTPLTLAHFGFDRDGSVLADAALPATLTADWRLDEENVGKPFPSYARLLANSGHPKVRASIHGRLTSRLSTNSSPSPPSGRPMCS